MTSRPADPAQPRGHTPRLVGEDCPGAPERGLSELAGAQLRTADGIVLTAAGQPAFLVTRTTRGWAVLTPDGPEDAADLVEALSLADLIAEDLGAHPEPGRNARRAARGAPSGPAVDDDPRDQQIAVLQRTVDQLEHALATRVTTERAIGVLAVQQSVGPREAFEDLRRRARSAGRAVPDLAREVLDGLTANSSVPAPAATRGEELPPGGRSRRVERHDERPSQSAERQH